MNDFINLPNFQFFFNNEASPPVEGRGFPFGKGSAFGGKAAILASFIPAFGKAGYSEARNKSETLDVVLHGGSKGMDSEFIQKIVIASRKAGNSVVAFDFPYLNRGEDHSSGPELKEEQEVLKTVLEFCRIDSFKHIRLIGKSLGGIVASYYLKNLAKEKCKKFSVVILGYILGDIDLKTFSGEITVIQGEKDRFGNIEAVKKDLKDAVSQNIKYHQIDGADHSYRNLETGKPDYENKAVEVIFRQ